jgi:hypothetical protein
MRRMIKLTLAAMFLFTATAAQAGFMDVLQKKVIKQNYKVSGAEASKITAKLREMGDWQAGLTKGKMVTLGRFSGRGWSSGMSRYVGKCAEVVSFHYDSRTYEPSVKVRGNAYRWRVSNIEKGCIASSRSSSSSSSVSRSDISRVKRVYHVSTTSKAKAVAEKLSAMPNSDWKRSLRVGQKVKLGRHSTIGGKKHWTSKMSKHIGDVVRIKRFSVERGNNEPVVSVEGNSYSWRVRNLRKPSGSSSSSLTYSVNKTARNYKVSTYKAKRILKKIDKMTNSSWKSNLSVGQKVSLGRHTKVSGKKNWDTMMSRYVGKTVRIKSFSVESGTNEPLVRVSGNSHSWRVRNLRKPSGSSSSKPSMDISSADVRRTMGRYKVSRVKATKIAKKIKRMSRSDWRMKLRVGQKVRLGRHTKVSGKRNWRLVMLKHVGKTVRIKSFSVERGNNEPLVRVSGNSYSWRVRNLRRP